MSPNIVTDDTSIEPEVEQDKESEETEDIIKEVDSLDEPMFNELVIDLKEDRESNSAEDTSNDNLVIDMKDDSNEEKNTEEGTEISESPEKR